MEEKDFTNLEPCGELHREKLFSIFSTFVLAHKGFRTVEISVNTSIQGDLGIDGDDAYALIRQIENEFCVDLSEVDGRYFVPEIFISYGDILLAPVVWPFMLLTGTGRKVELLVGDLLHAVRIGRWEAPARRPKYPWEKFRGGHSWK